MANSLTPRLNEIENVVTKNYLINGMFEFDQRMAFTSTIDNDTYIPDRWLKNAGDSSQVIEDTGIVGFKTAYELVSTTGHNFQQRIETKMLDDFLLNQTVTFYIYARITSGSTFVPQIRIAYAGATDDWATENIIETANMIGSTINSTFQKYSYSFTITQDMLDNGLSIRIGDFVGDIYTVQYSKAMLYLGTDEREFVRAGNTYANELQLCQRYYCLFYVSLGSAYPSTATAQTYSSVNFPVEMRTTPTLTAGTLLAGDNATSFSFYYARATGVAVRISQDNTQAGNFYVIYTDNVADAEL